MLCVTDGPVAASGYWWYEVELDSYQLEDGMTRGWVAAADHDGSAWIGYLPDTDPVEEPDELPVPILEYLSADPGEAPDGSRFVRYGFSVNNWRDFQDLAWDESSDAGPCGDGGGRIFVRFLDEDDVELQRFCRLPAPDELTDLWFEGPFGESPPELIWLEILDLETGAETFSSPMQIESPYTSHESPTP